MKVCNINLEKGLENYGENYIPALKHFINGYDFMRLGQAVNSRRWESAMMACRRMSMESDKLGLDCFARQFLGLKQNIGSVTGLIKLETKNS